MKTLLLFLLRVYQLCFSAFLGQNCRFLPTCSNYASTAIRQHGAAKGSWLTVKRLCKCHPWHAGGFDPVPTDIDKNTHTDSDAHFHAGTCKQSCKQ